MTSEVTANETVGHPPGAVIARHARRKCPTAIEAAGERVVVTTAILHRRGEHCARLLLPAPR